MNPDNRGYVFEVLHKVLQKSYLTDDADSRQEVIQVYERVMGYFSDWFEEDESHRFLRLSWRVASVLACQCFTDDAFRLSDTIKHLNEALALLEANKDVLEEADKEQEAMTSGIATPPGMMDGFTPPGSPRGDATPPDAGGTLPVGSPSLDEIGGSDDGGLMEYYPDSDDDDEDDEGASQDGDGAGVKEEVKKEEEKTEIKDESIAADVKKDIKTEVKKEGKKRPAPEAIELDSDVEPKEEVIDSEDSVNLVDSAEEDSDAVYESLSSHCEESDAVEEVDMSFKVPSNAASLRLIGEFFVSRCLATLFNNRGPLWARPKIDAFFQDVFYRRSIFTPDQQMQVEAWQARIKVMQKNGERIVGEANNPMEAHRPVVDSREMRTSIDSDSNAWAAKQTFDSRDRSGGSKIIR